MKITQLTQAEFSAAVPRLGEILADAVAAGAGVSFMLPFSNEDGAAYWRGLADALASGAKSILVAKEHETIAGVVILEKAWAPNQPHRGEVSKMLVHRDFRRRGIGTLLILALIEKARAMGLTLITFDAVARSPAAVFYRGLGFTCAGVIPGYAYSSIGNLDDTAIFYMKL